MNDINTLWNMLNKWRSRLPNVNSVSIIAFDDELRIRVDWYGDDHPYYTHIFTKAQLDGLEWFGAAEEYLLTNIENAYKKWEVGEE